MIGDSVRKGNLDPDTYREKMMGRHSKKMAIYQPGNEVQQRSFPYGFWKGNC